MRKKGSIPNSPSTRGREGVRERGYVRIGKKMIFIIVLLFGNNLQYKFNIWLQCVFIRTTPPTLPRTHTYTYTHTHTHTHTHILHLLSAYHRNKNDFLIYHSLISPWLFVYEFIEVKLFWYVISFIFIKCICTIPHHMESLCPYGQWEGGSVDVDRCWQEEEGSKITGNVWIFFMDDF